MVLAAVCEDCSGYDDFVGGTQPIADPQDCHRFYLCASAVEISDTSFPCYEGLMYDYVEKICKDEMDVTLQCAPACDICSFTCTDSFFLKAADGEQCSVYRTCDIEGSVLDIEFCTSPTPYFDGVQCQADITECCTCRPDECLVGDLSKIPDKRNCTNYYVCAQPGVPDERFHAHCEIGIFDELTRECSDDGTATCNNPCEESSPLTLY